MKALLVARKVFLELVRETKLFVMLLAFPLGFLALFAAAGQNPMVRTHPVLVCQLRHPAPPPASAFQAVPTDRPDCTGPGPDAAPVIGLLRAEKFDSGRPAFEVKPAQDGEEADRALTDKTAELLVVVGRDPTGSPVAILRGDALNPKYIEAATLASAVLQREADAAVGLRPAVRVVTSRYAAAAPATEFDYYTPGVFVFALLLVLPFASMIVAREIRWKTLRRLRLTRMRAFDLFAGITGALLLLGILNTALVFVVAPAFGFHNNGSTALALAVAVAMIFSGIGLGLIVGCFTTTDSQAMNIAAGVMMLQVFLSGSFFPIPAPTVFTLAGHEIGAFDVFPATHGYLALQQVLSDGAGLDAVAFRLGATVLLSLLCFVLGVVIFRRLRMRDAR